MTRPVVFDAPDLRVRMSREISTRLQALATADGLTPSDIVRSLILRAYEEKQRANAAERVEARKKGK
jgi:predicted DNA-binding protein